MNRPSDALLRLEWPKLVAGLTRIVRDVGRAEELAQDALVQALEKWPETGVPDNPGAWLMTTAKNRALNEVRNRKLATQKNEELGWMSEKFTEPADLDDDVGDDLLRLVFISCHPVLSAEARVALTLRLLCGLTTDEIARAFLAAEPTIAQRIVRAKKALADAKAEFEIPHGEDRAARLSSVLDVIYLVFNEGWAATAGDDLMRPGLVEDALRLGRVLQGLMPDEPEVHGLVALMELHASRAATRVDAKGAAVLLADQNRTRWDRLLIRRGLAALEKAEALAPKRGIYTLQAAISACHARARSAAETDWLSIATRYAELVALTGSPVVELNRGVAMAMAFGPTAGLAIIDDLRDEPALADYPFLPAARGDLLEKLGRLDEARAEFERAASLTTNARERQLLTDRARRTR